MRLLLKHAHLVPKFKEGKERVALKKAPITKRALVGRGYKRGWRAIGQDRMLVSFILTILILYQLFNLLCPIEVLLCLLSQVLPPTFILDTCNKRENK